MHICVIIPAAGSSSRFAEAAVAGGLDPGAIRSKLDEDLGGRPVLQRTVELFAQHPDVKTIIVAGPHDETAFADFKLRYGDKLGLLGVKLCRGGKTHRYETVAAALKLVPESATHVAIHDAARPCASAELIERLFEAAQTRDAVIPAIPLNDTLKRITKEPVDAGPTDPLAAILGAPASAPGLRAVEATVDRTGMCAVQTPQVFSREIIHRAYAQADLSSTDDAQLVERLGHRVLVVEGDARNIKITRPADLHLARLILNAKPPADRSAHKRF